MGSDNAFENLQMHAPVATAQVAAFPRDPQAPQPDAPGILFCPHCGTRVLDPLLRSDWAKIGSVSSTGETREAEHHENGDGR
jgi:hypothetical protein